MCSCASLPSLKRTMATSGTSTRFPVGATPGSIQSMGMVCVNVNTISSTSWSAPMVREIGVSSVSGGICRDEASGVELP